MEKLKKVRSDVDIINKLITYQQKLYRKKTMKLQNLKFECKDCHVYFTPSIERAKIEMKNKGVINVCRTCETTSKGMS